MSNLGKALAHDYATMGFATLAGENGLQSFDGKHLVELGDASSSGEKDDRLDIFVDGTLAESIDYDDKDFNSKLILALAEPLNF